MTKDELIKKLNQEIEGFEPAFEEYEVGDKEQLMCKYIQLLKDFSDAVCKSEYDMEFYESAFKGVMTVETKMAEEAVKPYENDPFDDSFDESPHDEQIKALQEGMDRLGIQSLLTFLHSHLSMIRRRVFDINEKLERFRNFASEHTEDEVQEILEEAFDENDSDDELIFDMGCSVNDARAAEKLMGREFAIFDSILRK